MQLFLQDREDPQAPSLHETILELCEEATRGGGAFAFATRDGVNLLLRDPVFQRFASRRRFDLIVGVDACTNENALNALQEATQELAGLTVRVFRHDRAGSLFHPKFCWFTNEDGGFLVVGSGNLTARGLRGSWEAFSVTELGIRSARSLEAQWTRWVALHEQRLLPLDNGDVRNQAALNVAPQRPARPQLPEVEIEIEAPEEIRADAAGQLAVLVAEIPRAAGRWNQANFSLDTFRNFFGAQPGRVQRVVLQQVNQAGVLGELENRPSVSVKSRNFRFELEAAAGLQYPAHGRPVAVFVRLAPRTFRYFLSMPGGPHHALLEQFLANNWHGRADRMGRVIADVRALANAWPNSPLWIAPLDVQD
jgi:hypothetical protein